ncbi:MAG TPA: carboxypeptidase-like regulatory domain-containing protein, partial [Solirubrobacterales bacterium]
MAGTRGGIGRIVAMVIGLVVVLALVLADAARAGTYNVAQCGWGIGAELDPTVPKTEGDSVYLHQRYCTAPPAGTPAGIEFVIGLANDGEQAIARARWAAPPGTNFAGVQFNWSGDLAPMVWQVAGIEDDLGFYGVAIAGGATPSTFVGKPITGPAPVFEVHIECLIVGATYGCTRSRWSRATLSGVTLTIDDPVPPTAKLGGVLVAPGWHRGTVPLELGAEDPVGGGLYREEATVDGAPVFTGPVACAVATIDGEVRGTSLRPCPATAAQAFEVDTRTLADGVHTLRGCAVDFGGGQGCAPDAQIQVDNSPPAVDFAAAREGRVAARVSDAFSGAAGGTISVRRADSESWTDLPTTLDRPGAGTARLSAQLPDLSAGAYVFRASATDAAGNGGSAQLRVSGSPAEVRRRAAGAGDGSGPAPRGGRRGAAGAHGRATHLVAYLVGRPAGGSRLTVDFGTGVDVRGRLTDRHGAGVADRPVTAVARAAASIGAPPERHRVVTDGAGRFELLLPAGTSRQVRVSFHGGGGFAPARSRPLALAVRAAVSLAAAPLHLRTGESVTLSGR